MATQRGIFKKQDIYYTPRWAIEPILKYIPKGSVIWECCCGALNISKVLEEHGYKVISTDITMGDEYDFIKYEPKEHYDYILTNPPFSIKTKIIKRCYELKKPFMLLLPISGIEGIERNRMYRDNGIAYFQFTRRVQYISTYTKGQKSSGAPFYSLWLGWNIPGVGHFTINYLDDEEVYMKWKNEINAEKKRIKAEEKLEKQLKELTLKI